MKTRSKNLTKKMLSILLSVAMGVSSFTTMETPVEVKAEETTEAHTHCVCGETHKDIGDHTTEEEVEWIAWTDAEELPSVDGNYYLTQDVEIGSSWRPAVNEDKKVKLCLNGHTIRYKSENKGSVINIACKTGEDGFVLSDCKGTGKITGGNSEQGGGGIRATNGAQIKMFGGTVTGNVANLGGGYYGDYFKMYGGSIEENTSTGSGGGIAAKLDFTMYGGTIKNNTATYYGGGIFGYLDCKKYVRIYGGSIEGNTANCGGGIANLVNTDITNTYVFLYDGASITKNTATSDAGGIAIVKNTPVICKDKTPYLNVEGKVIVDGNTVGDVENNILVTSTVGQTPYDYLVNLTGPLTEGSKLGIKATPGINFTSGWDTYMKNANPDEYFVSNVPNYHVERIGDELQLRSDDLGYRIEITKDIEDAIVIPGTDTLSVEASITGADASELRYQWYRTDGGKTFNSIEGATESTYAITAEDIYNGKKACENSYYCKVYKDGDEANATRTRTGKYIIKTHDKVIVTDEIKIFIDNSKLLNQKYSKLGAAFTVPEDANYEVKPIIIGNNSISQFPNNVLMAGTYGPTYLGLSAKEGYEFVKIGEKTPVVEPEHAISTISVTLDAASQFAKEGYKNYVYIILEVADMLEINQQPADLQFFEGYSKTLSVTTNNTEGVSYQWYQCDDTEKTNPREVSGATAATLEVPADLPIGTYYYYCKYK